MKKKKESVSVPPMTEEQQTVEERQTVDETVLHTVVSSPETFPHSDAHRQASGRIEVAKNSTLNTIIHIVINGKHDTQFGQTIHSGLISRMLQAHNTKNTALFLKTLQSYLEQAVMHVPQAGRREDIAKHMAEVQRLIDLAGLPEVSQKILRAATAASL